MLFKVFDDDNKFVQYLSLCISKKETYNLTYDTVLLKLKNTKISFHNRIIKIDFNYYAAYNPITITCAIDKGYKSYILQEIVSKSRRQELDAKTNYWSTASVLSDNSSTSNTTWTYTHGPSTTISIGSTNTLTNTVYYNTRRNNI